MRLQDKVAIITCGAHGMGEAEARLFAKEGAAVVIADLLQKEGEAVAADISANQGRVIFVQTDVTSEAAWKHLIATTIATYGRLAILVNNAGISGSSVGDELALAGWEKLMATNATSVFLGTTHAAAEMPKTGGGSVINISSIMGFIGGAHSHPGYSASKGAVRIFTKSAAVRFGPSGVRGQLRSSRLPATDAEQYELRRACRQDRRRTAAPPGRGDGWMLPMAYCSWHPTRHRSSPAPELVIDGGYLHNRHRTAAAALTRCSRALSCSEVAPLTCEQCQQRRASSLVVPLPPHNYGIATDARGNPILRSVKL